MDHIPPDALNREGEAYSQGVGAKVPWLHACGTGSLGLFTTLSNKLIELVELGGTRLGNFRTPNTSLHQSGSEPNLKGVALRLEGIGVKNSFLGQV